MDDGAGMAIDAARVDTRFAWRYGAAVLLAGALVALALAWWQPAPGGPTSSPSQAGVADDFGELPLAFERNLGQAGSGVDFVARSPDGAFLVAPDEVTAMLRGPGGREAALELSLPGAAPGPARPVERLSGRVNYLAGDDPSGWHTDVPTFARIRYPGVWPGVDLDWYGSGRRLEYDFRLAPGAEPSQVGMRVAGARELRVAGDGDLLIPVPGGTLRQRAPIAYQRVGGRREFVPASFSVEGDRVGFELGRYDSGRPLVIDPVLVYSGYVGGGASDAGEDIAVDAAGSAYVVGTSDSTDFDTTGADGVGRIEGHNGGSPANDAVVFKLTPSGNALAYATYLGGTNHDVGTGITVDSSGAAYVTGTTQSDDFNVVPDPGALQEDNAGAQDAFVSKLNPAGNSLAFSTYLGGGTNDFGEDIALDSSGAAYVAGTATSTDFPTAPSPGAFQTDQGSNDAFVSKLSPAGTALTYSTYLGGGGDDQGLGVAVDSSLSAYVTGWTNSAPPSAFPTQNPYETDPGDGQADVFVTKMTAAGTALSYSTYLGGGAFEAGSAIAVDGAGAAYVTGNTGSGNFDTTEEVLQPLDPDASSGDAFVTKFAPTGDTLAYSTYLGGTGSEETKGIVVDGSGAAHVGGQTDTTGFPTVEPVDTSLGAGDAFVSSLSPSGAGLSFSTLLGGSNGDSLGGIARDASGSIYLTGQTSSTNFDIVNPVEGDGGAEDAFVSKIGEPAGAGTPAEPGPPEPTPGGGTPPGPPPPNAPPAGGTCAGKPVTIAGTEGKDKLVGTKGADVIAGLGGKDKIRGGGKGDRICGGKGKDRANGGGGKDRLLGEPGSDRLAGAGGNDLLKGAKGNDRLKGGPGRRDRCAGGGGKKDRAAGSCEREPGVP